MTTPEDFPSTDRALPAVGARIRIRSAWDPESEMLVGTVVEYIDNSPYRTGINGLVVLTDRDGIGIYALTSPWEPVKTARSE